MSPCPHGNQLPGLVLVWVFLIEVWDPSGCGGGFSVLESRLRCGCEWGLEVLGPAHRPQAPQAPCRSPMPHTTHHFNTALPLKNILEVSGLCS